MPTEEKKTVDIDTSGPGAEIDVPEEKDETVVETESKETKQEAETTDQEETKKTETSKKSDEDLEEYSRGVQSRIAKLTRKMREAERREQAAVQYARAVDQKRLELESRFKKTDSDYFKKFESSVQSGLESVQRELASAIEDGDAKAQTEANKKLASLAFENAKLEQLKQHKETVLQEEPVRLSDGGRLPEQTPSELPESDLKAEDWAAKNAWFGQNRAMTFTAFEIHKDLVEKEGFDPKSDEYYKEVDKRIRLDFPSKFGSNQQNTSKPIQSVASANRSVKPGRQIVRLTSSQVAIAKKLGVPLEEYAKQLKLTKEV